MPDPTTVAPRELPRRIGFWGASAVMVGIIIGSGIFAAPTAIAGQMGSPWMILATWLAGGVLSLFGALTYSELATMYPQSGGVYVFMREGFGRPVAFVFGWTYMLITKPAAAAGIAVVFGQHVNSLLGTGWDAKWVTTVILVVLTGVNVRGVRLGTGVAGVFTFVKVAAIIAIIALGVVLLKGSAANLKDQPAPLDVRTGLPIPVLMALTPVMFKVMWTYDGWSDVGAIAGEVKDPQRELPKIYLAGTVAVTILYVAVNAVYLYMMPLSEMAGVDTVAPVVMRRLLGPAGGIAVTVLILVSTLGSTHGSILTGARVTYAQARDGLLFRFLGRVHPRYETPAVALWSQLALSITALWLLKGFAEMADAFVFTMWIFYGLAAAAIFVFRARRPDAPRPYRCWGYPVIPALFILAAIVMTAMSIYQDPRHTLPWLGLLAAGVPVYYVWNRFWPPPAPAGE